MFIKVEAKHQVDTSKASDRKHKTVTDTFYYREVENAFHRIKYELTLGHRITIKEITEPEYIKGKFKMRG